MERLIILFMLIQFTGIHAQKLENKGSQNQGDCFTWENFSRVKSFILEKNKSKSTKEISKNRDSAIVSVVFETRRLKLDTAQQRERIIVTHLKGINRIPSYFVLYENDTLRYSAYYSRFDTEEEIQKRKEDWCRVASSIIRVNIPDQFLEYFEQGNTYWKARNMVRAQTAYQKFVDLMKNEGMNEQIPQFVRDRLFKCRFAKH